MGLDEKVFVGVYVPRRLDRRVEVLAAELDTSKSMLAELGLRLMLAILEAGYVPDDLGYLLRSRDPEALEELIQLLRPKAEAKQG